MEIKRAIFVYGRINGDLIEEKIIDIPIDLLKTILKSYESDADLMKSYDITPDQAFKLYQSKCINFDFSNNIYQMECYLYRPNNLK